MKVKAILNIPTCIQVRISGVTTSAGEKREKALATRQKAYNQLFKADQSTHSRPEVAVVSERAFDGDRYLDPWSENAGS